MMKTAGTVMIVISVFLIGLSFYSKYKTRSDSLSMFIDLLTAFKLELGWSRKSLDEILLSFKCDKLGRYLDEVRLLMQSQGVCDAFTDKNVYYKSLCLTNEDTVLLKYFFSESGKGGLESEKVLCEKTLSALECKRQEATVDFKKLGPLALKLGLVCGIWLVIILM